VEAQVLASRIWWDSGNPLRPPVRRRGLYLFSRQRQRRLQIRGV